MASLYPRFQAALTKVASIRSTRVRHGYLKGHTNVLTVTGNVEGTLYVSQNRRARHWTITESSVRLLPNRKESWSIILLYQQPTTGYLLTPDLVKAGVKEWDRDSYTGQFSIQASDETKETYPFFSLEELFGMLRFALTPTT